MCRTSGVLARRGKTINIPLMEMTSLMVEEEKLFTFEER